MTDTNAPRFMLRSRLAMAGVAALVLTPPAWMAAQGDRFALGVAGAMLASNLVLVVGFRMAYLSGFRHGQER